MSNVNIFYPHNQDLAKRCQELIDDITGFQANLTDHADNNDFLTGDLKNLVNFLMAANGYETFDEVVADAMKTLDPEEQEKFKKSLKEIKDLDKDMEYVYQANTLLATISGGVGMIAKSYDFIKSGALTQAFTKRINSLRKLFAEPTYKLPEELEETERMLDTVFGDTAEAGSEVLTTGAKVARFAKILGVVSVGLDLFLVGLAAWEGDEQEKQLIKNIHYLDSRRVLAKIYTEQAGAMVDFSGQLKTLLSMWQKNTNHAFDDFIKDAGDGYIKNVSDAYVQLTVEAAYNKLHDSDKARGSYLNKDWNLDQIFAEISKEPSDTVEAADQPPKKN